jgi:hypothetical protein
LCLFFIYRITSAKYEYLQCLWLKYFEYQIFICYSIRVQIFVILFFALLNEFLSLALICRIYEITVVKVLFHVVTHCTASPNRVFYYAHILTFVFVNDAHEINVWFEFFTAVTMKITIFWDVTQFRLTEVYRCFGRMLVTFSRVHVVTFQKTVILLNRIRCLIMQLEARNAQNLIMQMHFQLALLFTHDRTHSNDFRVNYLIRSANYSKTEIVLCSYQYINPYCRLGWHTSFNVQTDAFLFSSITILSIWTVNVLVSIRTCGICKRCPQNVAKLWKSSRVLRRIWTQSSHIL